MSTRQILALTAAAMLLGPFAGAAFAASSPPVIPPVSARTVERRAGGHFSIVGGEPIRQCADLEAQFDRALAGTHKASWTRAAVTLGDAGATACRQGSRWQGVEELRSAVAELGAVPHLTY